MKPGQQPTNTQHKGVRIVRKGDKLRLRWKDPVQQRYRDQTLGEVSMAVAIEAAKAKKVALDALKARWLSGDLVAAPTDSDLIQEFIESADTQGTKINRELAGRYLRQMQDAMASRGWNELQRHDLLRVSQLVAADNKLGATTKNLRLRTCKRFFNWMNERGYLGTMNSDLISSSIKFVKAPEHSHGNLLSPFQLQELFGTMLTTRPDVALFFMLKVLTGLRIGELINIQGRDVISGSGRKSHLLVKAPKTGKTRKVNLSASPLAEKILMALRVRNEPDYLFFPTVTKNRNTILLYRKFQKHLTGSIAKRMGYKVNPKDLRATHEALLASLEGWDLFKVAKQLGHGIQIAEKNYTEDIQMMDLPSGTSIEQVAGLESLGELILERNGCDSEAVAQIMHGARYQKDWERFVSREKLKSLKGDKHGDWAWDKEELESLRNDWFSATWDAAKKDRVRESQIASGFGSKNDPISF